MFQLQTSLTKYFENIVGKEESAGNQHFLPLTLSRTSPAFYVTAAQVF